LSWRRTVAAKSYKVLLNASNNNNNNNNKETGVQLDKKHCYEHVPKSVEASQEGKVTILWNQQIQTDKTISNNKSYIIIRDHEKGTCMLIDVAISGVEM